jgi:3-phosphoshikimate 1-carboxyvinyltransferase
VIGKVDESFEFQRMKITVSKPDKNLQGEIVLDGSKSISNRALIIRALCGENFHIDHLSTSLDTRLLQHILASEETVLDAGAAGTTFRFLTAYLAMQDGSRILTGSERMKQRPVAPLVDALRHLGADIEYLEREGFPPLRINAQKKMNADASLKIAAGTSSQFISALAMIALVLPGGLKMELQGEIVSRPYIEMTLKLMGYFGASHAWEGNTLIIPHQPYQPRELAVEADWSAASYFYVMAAFSQTCDLRLVGLSKESLQGDAVLPVMMESFGIQTVFQGNSIVLRKSGSPVKPFFEWDFLPCPDLAQSLAVVCAGLGVQGLFSGLSTLRIKETDRIAALQNELAKVQVFLSRLPARFSKKSEKEFYSVEGLAKVQGAPTFTTYEDHRMAMAFAPLAMLGEIQIEEPGVVKKSYPAFWQDLEKLGFVIQPKPAV